MLSHHAHFFTCAAQVAAARAAPNQRVVYYLITDSVQLREAALRQYDEVVVSGLGVHHVDVAGSGADDEGEGLEGARGGAETGETPDQRAERMVVERDLHGLHNTVVESWSV